MAALVVGNANYINGGALRNPVNDAVDVGEKLKSYGFTAIVVKDATHKDMDKKLKEFKELLKTNDVGLFFFAGHGMQIDGRNYLLATDTDNADETEAKHSSLLLDKVIEVMEKSPAATKIVILDACRDNPWERAWNRTAATRGLASVYAPKGTIIGFATSPGELASDGRGRNGTYTAALLQHIDEPDCTIETMFKQVRNTVAAETRGKQTSWEHTSLSGNFFFNLSLGKLVTTYSASSLADASFVIDSTKPSHKIIKGLKSLNYYTQNDALEMLSASTVKGMHINNLFVLGRNIYQAACGGSNSAKAFIRSFRETTIKYPAKKIKALLDGMLFEVFFDPQAKIRSEIKGALFNDVFELRKYPTLRDSFDFLAETLVAARGDFYALPGRGHELSVTVATKKVKDDYLVDSVYVNGTNVLRLEDEEWASDSNDAKLYSRRTIPDFEEQLSQELVVPRPSLKVTYTPSEAASGPIKVPLGYTVAKG
ncbi:caspase family protein [Rhizobium leguminosarum]|jgi:hypothetical protein|uniref:Caspase family protein n=1 Tax=Rhizobium leguminosarum TaxID=384 RepID=A0ABD7PLB0_RHILE|nr:caspase family protein [Rhizobium leguminosarum]TAV87887.1 caspase family protein [Rhizobium leguminosarum]TAV92470.1 caspase family protein [Rhizobium leguminosarum]TAW28157.1 caspase family protein [Rhizobium leguminosarum]TAW33540.1 caspase family protein [Rhizobium leguminosarum]TAW41891.1 caspase family protein [Rhizobium leguminosarum]